MMIMIIKEVHWSECPRPSLAISQLGFLGHSVLEKQSEPHIHAHAYFMVTRYHDNVQFTPDRCATLAGGSMNGYASIQKFSSASRPWPLILSPVAST
jgi:hypothetical protein